MAIGARHRDRRKDAFANAVTSMILLMIGLGFFCIAPLKKTVRHLRFPVVASHVSNQSSRQRAPEPCPDGLLDSA